MTYGRILTPRFFVDTPNWLMSRGVASSEFSVKATNTGNHFVGPDSGFVDAELFDMRPSNQVVFSTKDDSTSQEDHVLIVIDTQGTTERKHFVAILNHNMATAQGKFRVATSASDITAIDPTVRGCTEVFNADETSNIFTPDRNGVSIVTLDSESSNRYIAIQIEGSNGDNFDASNDLKIGCVMVGEYLDSFGHAPDLSVKRNVSFGTNLQTSIGGSEYSNAQWLENLGTDSQSGQPFRIEGSGTGGTTYYYRMGGKMGYDMNFSFVDDTNILSSDMSSALTGDTFLGDVWMRTGGSHIPFIFTPDSTSTTPGDYLFARFMHDSLDMTQVANNMWNVGISIRETW